MTNNRQGGKRWERWFVNNGLRDIFPNIRRNAGIQAQSGGVDLEETGQFNIEVKGGKKYKSVMIRKIIDQAESEGYPDNLTVALVKPLKEKAYAIMPFDDFLRLLREKS